MATVNLSNSGWSTSTTTSDIEIDINSERIKFEMDSHAETAGYAKVYIAIDPSKYSSVTFQYSQQNHDGIRDLWFGIWDSEDASSKAGTIGIHSSADTKWSESGGSVTMSVPNSSSTKYVGLRFYGREDTTTTYGVSTRVFTPSLTATTRGYTLTYDANGGSGAPSSEDSITSTTISSVKPTRSGYDFLGWSTSSSATSASYFAGNLISLNSNITLYAVWKRKGQVYIRDSLGNFNPYKVLIRDSSGWNQYVPYIYTYSGWEIYSG